MIMRETTQRHKENRVHKEIVSKNLSVSLFISQSLFVYFSESLCLFLRVSVLGFLLISYFLSTRSHLFP